MSKDKVGRNDPCPCGSGKKYKNCCLNLEEGATDLFTRYSQTLASVKVKLDQEYKSEIKKIRKSAQQNFLYYATSQQLPADHESIFSDWLWFDMTDLDGQTLARDYLSQHADFMPENLKEGLQALADSSLSLYEPCASGAGFLELRDIFSQNREQVILKEAFAEDLTEKSFLLLGRLVKLPEGSVFSGMVLAVENNDGQERYLTEHLHYLQELEEEADIQSLLKAHADLLYGLFDHAYHKKHILINDIRVLKLTAEETSRLQEILDHSELTLVHGLENWRWYKADAEGYLRLILGEDELISCISNLDSFGTWSDVLGGAFPALQNWQLVNTRFLRQAPPSDLVPVWFNIMQDQETERWLLTPHSELDNQTPLELLQTENGREKILNMLDSFAERLEEGNEGIELINYMRLRILAM